MKPPGWFGRLEAFLLLYHQDFSLALILLKKYTETTIFFEAYL